MLSSYGSREQRIADLEVHGWEPVKAGEVIVPGAGIWNEQLQVGFRVVDHLSAQPTVRKVHRPDMVPCLWREVTDEVLERIDIGLRWT
jgi:hypothetical protein